MTSYKDLIYKKRQGQEHSENDIKLIINGLVNKDFKDYQLAAWLMAVCINGMSLNECAYLTEAMAKSGEIIDLSEIGNFVIDKHSTGGVGDKTTLVFAPLLASVGLPIAKLSGRGLGHTGGTIDKLESIPGFNTSLTIDKFIDQVKNHGIAIGGQTSMLAPADGIIYSIRDVTSTVDSIPLIASSVVSKKIAAGANVIVLDVKFGSGAFMKTYEEAYELSKTMIEVAKRLNKKLVCLISSMEEPLGLTIGHSLEIIETIETLKGNGPEDLTNLCLTLASIAMFQAELVSSVDNAKRLLQENINNGKALEKFKELIQLQGGNQEVINDYSLLGKPKYLSKISAQKSGYISKCDALTVALACKALGAGRDIKGESINLKVGIILNKKITDYVEKDDVLAEIHADSHSQLAYSEDILRTAYDISDKLPEKPQLIRTILGL